VKYPDGSLRHFPNVPESFRANIDGQQLGIHDLKPGMTLRRTVVRTTTSQKITTVQTVKGKIWHVTPPHVLILTLEDGTNQSFKIPDGQKFDVSGRMVDAWGLKKGMLLSATRVTEEPQTVVSENSMVTGSAPPPPPPDRPILVAILRRPDIAPAPSSTEDSAQPPADEGAGLPKTGSELPLIALLGFICLSGSFGLRLLRR
jgi:LPXTG-motif cell wall-anchored protein